MKPFLKRITPPVFIDLFKKFSSHKYGWKGNYSSWEEAEKESTGYGEKAIIKKIREASLKVKNGEALFERDGVIFKEPDYNWPLLAGLLYAGTVSKGSMNVIDFGGSLGSTFYQYQEFLNSIENLSWSIVEQQNYVEIGKAEFEQPELTFYYALKDSFKSGKTNILLISNTLQYVKAPYEILQEAVLMAPELILFDKTLFAVDDHERITVQTVSPEIYEGSYPCWYLSHNKLVQLIEAKGYRLIGQYDNYRVNNQATLIGMIFIKEKDEEKS